MTDATRTLSAGGREETLTEREYDLLALLARDPGRPISRGELFDALWAGDSTTANVVDVYVGYLRRKLAPCLDFGFEIKTLRNRGFCLDGVAPERGGPGR